jgi:hypothetical protein
MELTRDIAGEKNIPGELGLGNRTMVLELGRICIKALRIS